MNTYRAAFATHIADASLRPLVLTYHLFGYIVLIVYLCISHTKRPWVYAARWPVLAFILAFQWKTLWKTTSMSMATGFAAGLMAAWGAVWAVTLLVLNRPQFDARRVHARRKGSEGKHENGNGNGSSTGSNGFAKEENGVAKKRVGNGRPSTDSGQGSVGTQNMHEQKIDPTSLDYDPSKDDALEYYWQSYPEHSFKERFAWVFDLIVNFRMLGWNLAIPPLPSLPPGIASQLSEPVSNSHISPIGLIRYDTRRSLLRARLPYFIAGYFLLDALKTLMMTDPYFIFGPTTYALPPHLTYLSNSPFLLHFTRQLITASCIILSLEMVFMMAPLGLSILLSPSLLGQTAEAWYYPTTWGSFSSSVLEKGLNGLWGSWWHQTFRFAFAAPTNHLIANGIIKPHTNTTRILSLLFAFGISGLLHSAGSISQFPLTHPTHAPIFFMLQALGITLQTLLCTSPPLKPLISKLPTSVRKTGNLLFTLGWLLGTSSWLTDDFARGGIWLYEPVPISVFRGMGWGERDAGWWCWDGLGVGWYAGEHWWESGVAI